MDEFLQEIFSGEIEFQCQFILLAAIDLMFRSEPRTRMTCGGTCKRSSFPPLTFLKMFWGSGGAKGGRRKPLRDYFEVADNSPFRDTVLRNDFEHFDERLEKWSAGSTNQIYMGRNIGPPSMIQVSEEPPNQRFQHFDPATGMVTFWARLVSLHDLVGEATRIL